MNPKRLRSWLNTYPSIVDSLFLTTLFVMVLVWRWNAWIDPFVDFGREVYVPWRLSEGAVLYKDIAYHAGILSPYFNAAVFSLFGASLNVLIWVNVMIAAVVAGLLYRIMKLMAGRLAAVVAVVVFELLFLGAQYNLGGNRNWIAPYSHELTHGLLICLLAILAFRNIDPDKQPPWRTCLGGALVGLTFVMKPEIFLAAWVSHAAIVLLWLLQVSRSRDRLPIVRRIALQAGSWFIGAGASILSSASVFVLVLGGDWYGAFFGAWRYVFGQGNLDQAYFKVVMGTDDLGRNLMLMLAGGGIFLAIVAVIALVSWLARKLRPRHAVILVGAAALVVGGITAQWWQGVNLIWRILPVFCTLVFIGAGIHFRRLFQDADPDERQRAGLLFVWAAFSATFLLKIAFYSKLAHYGFVLAMPAVVLLCVSLLKWGPRLLFPQTDWLVRLLFFGFVAGMCAHSVKITIFGNHMLNTEVHWDGQTIRSDYRAKALDQILNRTAAQLEPENTLLVLPEHELPNFLLKRRNPIPYGNLNPHQIHIFDEEKILAALKATPPDYIMVVDRKYFDYDTGYFGKDYAMRIGQWIKINYKLHVVLSEFILPGARSPVLLFKYQGRHSAVETPVTE